MVLATIGSLGDLHPFIALALALQRRGADVLVACAAEYKAKVESAGLAFRPVRPSFADMERLLGMDRALLTQAMLANSDFLFRRLIMPSVRMSYEDMRVIIEGADMVLTSSLGFGARLAAEKSSVPWLAVVLQPLMFFSAFDPPVIPKAAWLGAVFRRLGPSFTGIVLEIFKRAVGGLMGPLRALRHEIGLAPTRRNPLFDGQFSATGAIALYSSALGRIQTDYPHPTSIVGFASYDSEDGAASLLDPSIREFLDAGPAPLVFTLGSLVINMPGTFYRESLAAARRLGKRAVLLVGADALAGYAGLNSAAVFVGAYAPYSLLFPRAEAVIHQGGIGTLAQALRAGRPQLIVPFFADQLDNAARAVNLGVARSLTPRRYARESARHELSLLLSSGVFLQRALAVRDQLLHEDGAAEGAAETLKRLDSCGS